MPKFVVVRGRDAWVIEEAIIEADSAKEAAELVTWRAEQHKLEWVQTGDVRQFDDTDVFEDETRPLEDGEKLEEIETLQVTAAERDTILAALRYWKWDKDGESPDNAMLDDIATNGGSHEALDAEAIDELCEKINT